MVELQAVGGAQLQVLRMATILRNLGHEVILIGQCKESDIRNHLLGFNINPDFRIGYAYDYTLSNLGDYNSGSHEIMLLYDFNRKQFNSPRFF